MKYHHEGTRVPPKNLTNVSRDTISKRNPKGKLGGKIRGMQGDKFPSKQPDECNVEVKTKMEAIKGRGMSGNLLSRVGEWWYKNEELS
jgi:hypothetical protein